MVTDKKIKLLLSKLRSPLPFEFICGNVLNTNNLDCTEVLNELIEDGIIEKNDNFYKLKNNEN